MNRAQAESALSTWETAHTEIEALEEEAETAVRDIEKAAHRILEKGDHLPRTGQWPKLRQRKGSTLIFDVSNGRDLHDDFPSYISIESIIAVEL